MPNAVEYNKELGLVVYTFTGVNSSEDIHHATSRGISLGKEFQTNKYLVDIRELEFTGSLVGLLELPEKQYKEEGLNRQSKIALIQPKSEKARKEAKFYENASVNRFWTVRTFITRDEAIEWLKPAN